MTINTFYNQHAGKVCSEQIWLNGDIIAQQQWCADAKLNLISLKKTDQYDFSQVISYGTTVDGVNKMEFFFGEADCKNEFGLRFFNKDDLTKVVAININDLHHVFVKNNLLCLNHLDIFKYIFNERLILNGLGINPDFLKKALGLGCLSIVNYLNIDNCSYSKDFFDQLAKIPLLKELDFYIKNTEEQQHWTRYFHSIRPDVAVNA